MTMQSIKHLNQTEFNPVLAMMGNLQALFLSAEKSRKIFKDEGINFNADASGYIVILDKVQNRLSAFCHLIRSDDTTSQTSFGRHSKFDYEGLLAAHPDKCFAEIGPFTIMETANRHRAQGLIWQAISEYCRRTQVDYVVGCISFDGQYPAAHALALSYLHHNYLAAPQERVTVKAGVTMDIMPAEAIKPRDAYSKLPPLLRYCLRLGAKIGEGVSVDRKNHKMDVFLMIPTS